MEHRDSFPMKTVLELACAAQRINKEYVKVTAQFIPMTTSSWLINGITNY